jgi:hypothetical protein
MKEVHEKDDKVPGEPTTIKSKMLCAGSAMLEKFDPINQICDHLVGFHFYSGDMSRQVIAHHYCSVINEDVRQCVVYDSDKSDAKLIGVEYIISDRLFLTLPEEEKKLWHSHVYEVKSGMLMAPNTPNLAEKEVMKMLIKTYGKTFHFWQVDRGDKLPMGVPTLMMAFTEDGQVNPDLIRRRDELLGVNTLETRKLREDIETPNILPGADNWKTGSSVVLGMNENKMDFNMEKRKFENLRSEYNYTPSTVTTTILDKM